MTEGRTLRTRSVRSSDVGRRTTSRFHEPRRARSAGLEGGPKRSLGGGLRKPPQGRSGGASRRPQAGDVGRATTDEYSVWLGEVEQAERVASDLDLPFLEEVEASLRLSPAARRILGMDFVGSFEDALSQLTGAATSTIDELLGDLNSLGRAQATLLRHKVSVWSDGGRRTAIVLPVDASSSEAQRLATINHELANGITALASIASMAIRSGGDAQEALAQIELTSRATLESVRATRRALESTPPQARVDVIPFDATPIFRELFNGIRPLATQRGVQLDGRIENDLHMEGRPGDLRSIVWNLVKNAIEADSSQVRFGACNATDRVRIVVDDDGVGMDSECQSRAFEPFFTTKDEGNGLGLPLVRHLVERLDGELVIESEQGRGTRIVVSFRRAASATGPITSGVRSRHPLRGITLSLVGSQARSMADALSVLGAEIVDPAEALQTGAAIGIVVAGGVEGRMSAGALRPFADYVVWIGRAPSNAPELCDGVLRSAHADALVDFVTDLDLGIADSG